MATTLTNVMTADQFYDWAQRPENRDRAVELERGEIVEMPPPGQRHGFVCGNAAGILRDYARTTGKGYICSNDTGVVIETDPDTIRGPDVVYYADNQTIETMALKYAAQPPLLAVEVISPNDGMNRMVHRVAELMNAGVAMVWVVDPAARDVSVYRPGREPVLIEKAGELTGEDVLEGFRCKVSELFAMPGGE